MKAVILAGGLGTRLLPYTKTLPKPMLPLGGKPILEYEIEWIRKNGIKEIILCVSHLRKKIKDYFGDGERFGVKIEYAISNKPLATAGQLKTAEKFIGGTFVCLYGDSIYNFSLRDMIKQHKKSKSNVTMSLYDYKFNLKYGVINTKNSGQVNSWNEKPEFSAKINIGCYVMEPEVFQLIPKNIPYEMDNVIRKLLVKKRKVGSVISKKGFIDIGDKETYEKTNEAYSEK